MIKASGLAGGKGVIVAQSAVEAERAIDAMLSDRVFGAAGREILIEEFMDGEEISLFAITDGQQALPLLAAQDHKRLLEGDFGPNTGGMGAYAPTSRATPELVAQVMSEIIRPTLAAMREAGSPFTGLLYAGLMITERRTQGRGIQLPVRRSRNAGSDAAHGFVAARIARGGRRRRLAQPAQSGLETSLRGHDRRGRGGLPAQSPDRRRHRAPAERRGRRGIPRGNGAGSFDE